jgi:hypothetical protein
MRKGKDKNKSDKPSSGFVSQFGVLFLIVISLFVVIFIVALRNTNNVFRSSQEDIKRVYSEHVFKADSICNGIIVYHKKYSDQVANINSIMLTDSLVKLSLGEGKKLSRDQFESLSLVITKYFEGMERMHEQYDSKMRHDSLLLCMERQLLEGQTKTMLDLHLDKVEHEYSNITLWAAVLTILFLVFSFYSIFKMDELVKRGNEGVEKIHQLKDEGEMTISRIKIRGRRIINNTKQGIEEQQKIANETYASLLSQNEDLQKRLQEAESRFNNKADEIIEAFRNHLDELIKNYEANLGDHEELCDIPNVDNTQEPNT